MKRRKRIRRLLTKPHLICKWGYKVKLEESHEKKGFRFHFHCYDCSRDSFFRAWLDVPDHCPFCWNETFLAYWATRDPWGGLFDSKPETFSYKCVCCKEISSFASSVELPRTCPKCGKAQRDE